MKRLDEDLNNFAEDLKQGMILLPGLCDFTMFPTDITQQFFDFEASKNCLMGLMTLLYNNALKLTVNLSAE